MTEGDIMKSAILSMTCAMLALAFVSMPAVADTAVESVARPDIDGLIQKAERLRAGFQMVSDGRRPGLCARGI
jgi:hypothetical protein